LVCEKPIRIVRYIEKGTFKQFRRTKNANVDGRNVHRGWLNSTLKDGRDHYLTFSTAPRVISGMISPRNRTPNPQEKMLLEANIKKYEEQELNRELPVLAKGSYGIVYKGRVNGIQDTVVIKDIHIRDETSIDEWAREIKTMRITECPYVMQIFGFSTYENVLTIIMEYAKNGDLFTLLHKKKYPFTVLQKISIARQFLSGLDYLHTKKVLHRDIKSMNILVTENFSCKLTDFGLSKLVADEYIWNTANAGTPLWMAPEVRAAGPYLFPADIYSTGLVLFEIFENILPEWDRKKGCVQLPETFPSSELVLPCIRNDPETRYTAAQLLNFFDGKIVNPVLTKLREKYPKNN